MLVDFFNFMAATHQNKKTVKGRTEGSSGTITTKKKVVLKRNSCFAAQEKSLCTRCKAKYKAKYKMYRQVISILNDL